jgi:hypothetical protein
MVAILSSLLPADGFVTMVAMLNYTLFFVVVVGLLLDLKPGLQTMFASAGEFNPASVRVYPATPPPPRPGRDGTKKSACCARNDELGRLARTAGDALLRFSRG